MLGCIAGALLAAVLALTFLRGSGDHDNGTDPATTAKTGRQPGDQSPDDQRGGVHPNESWQPHTGPVPILMYHVIGPAAGAEDYPGLFLDTGDFRDQVNWLSENGYTAVTLVQVQDAWYDGGTLPPKPIVLSFDDGYLGQYLYAMPILEKQGWAGQLNLKAEGSDLSSRQVRRMYEAGWEIASHSIDHPDLTTLDPTALKQELTGSKSRLEDELGVEIVNFCYPAGQYDDTVIAAVRAAGYRGATTVNPGLAERSMPFELERIRIDRGDSSSTLATKLSSAGL